MRILLHKDDVIEIGVADSLEKAEIVHLNAHGRLLSFPKKSRRETPDYIGFLHRHPKMEMDNKIDDNHVIVDKKDWIQLRNYGGLLDN